MTVRYKVTAKALSAVGDVVLTVQLWDDAVPGTIYTDKVFGPSLTDAFLSDWAAKRFAAFAAAAATSAAITDKTALPAIAKVVTPPDTSKNVALFNAITAFNRASRNAQVAARGDKDEMTALAALIQAETDAAQVAPAPAPAQAAAPLAAAAEAIPLK